MISNEEMDSERLNRPELLQNSFRNSLPTLNNMLMLKKSNHEAYSEFKEYRTIKICFCMWNNKPISEICP